MMTVSKSVVRRLKTQSKAPALREVYARWYQDGLTRNARPWRPETAAAYKSQIETNILPSVGDLPIDTVGNTVLKDLANEMKAKGLGAATIQRNLNNIKDIRGFLTDEDGQPLYPYVWNSKMIDAPVVDKKAQKRPIASLAAVQAGLSCVCASKGTKMLLAVLAGSGMRIQEALALDYGLDTGNSTVWLPKESKIIVRVQRDGDDLVPTKTRAGDREIDVPSALNDFMKRSIGLDVVCPLFSMSEGFYRSELIKCGVIGGFHSLRRFRVTHLRTEGVPDPIVHFWVGHEDKTVTDGYTIVKSEIEKRKAWVEKVGLGFQLPETL